LRRVVLAEEGGDLVSLGQLRNPGRLGDDNLLVLRLQHRRAEAAAETDRVLEIREAPDGDGLVLGRARQELAVGPEAKAADGSRVPGESADLCSSRAVVEFEER